eukprot:542766-Pyramimonas_sp.AAC.2
MGSLTSARSPVYGSCAETLVNGDDPVPGGLLRGQRGARQPGVRPQGDPRGDGPHPQAAEDVTRLRRVRRSLFY